MDNASKALIIAGAILIAVMLVSLGVMLYNTAAGVAESSIGSMEQLGVQGFNGQFETYFGGQKSREQVKGLIRKVLANNSNVNNPTIKIDGSEPTATTEQNYYSVPVSTHYTIKGAYSTEGYVDNITITPENATGGGPTTT